MVVDGVLGMGGGVCVFEDVGAADGIVCVVGVWCLVARFCVFGLGFVL